MVVIGRTKNENDDRIKDNPIVVSWAHFSLFDLNRKVHHAAKIYYKLLTLL